jgi:hypothetical protein
MRLCGGARKTGVWGWGRGRISVSLIRHFNRVESGATIRPRLSAFSAMEMNRGMPNTFGWNNRPKVGHSHDLVAESVDFIEI